MLRRDCVRPFVKIFGLIILLSTLVGLPWRIDAFAVQAGIFNARGTVDRQALALLAGSHFALPVIYAAFGLGLLWWSRAADSTAPAPERGAEAIEASDPRDVEAILVGLLGLYFFAGGLAELCRWGFGLGLSYLVGRPAPLPALFWTGDLGSIAEAAMKLMIGILLVLGRGRTAALRHRLQAWVRKWRTWPD